MDEMKASLRYSPSKGSPALLWSVLTEHRPDLTQEVNGPGNFADHGRRHSN
jgi:hypothetical protein